MANRKYIVTIPRMEIEVEAEDTYDAYDRAIATISYEDLDAAYSEEED